MFKSILLAMVVAAAAQFAAPNAKADVFVQGHFRPNGTYVAPHYRSNPDYSFYNNWSTYPNINPYTGNLGTRMTPPQTSSYGGYRSYYPSYPSYSSPGTYRGRR